MQAAAERDAARAEAEAARAAAAAAQDAAAAAQAETERANAEATRSAVAAERAAAAAEAAKRDAAGKEAAAARTAAAAAAELRRAEARNGQREDSPPEPPAGNGTAVPEATQVPELHSIVCQTRHIVLCLHASAAGRPNKGTWMRHQAGCVVGICLHLHAQRSRVLEQGAAGSHACQQLCDDAAAVTFAADGAAAYGARASARRERRRGARDARDARGGGHGGGRGPAAAASRCSHQPSGVPALTCSGLLPACDLNVSSQRNLGFLVHSAGQVSACMLLMTYGCVASPCPL